MLTEQTSTTQTRAQGWETLLVKLQFTIKLYITQQGPIPRAWLSPINENMLRWKKNWPYISIYISTSNDKHPVQVSLKRFNFMKFLHNWLKLVIQKKKFTLPTQRIHKVTALTSLQLPAFLGISQCRALFLLKDFVEHRLFSFYQEATRLLAMFSLLFLVHIRLRFLYNCLRQFCLFDGKCSVH